MVEYNRQVDYSMPRQCGLYPPPPIEYLNARALVLILQCSPNTKKRYIPPELESIDDGIDIFIILEYPNTTIGPYNECIMLLNCKYRDVPGVYVFSIYVDDDVALTAGREIWGIPKKMAKIELSPIKNNKITGKITRKGTILFDVEVEIKKEAPGMDPKAMFEALPFYNLKLIPDVANNTKPVLRQITETVLVLGDIHKQNVAVLNYFKTSPSQYDITDEILKDATKDLGGFYVEYDFILPNGRVLE